MHELALWSIGIVFVGWVFLTVAVRKEPDRLYWRVFLIAGFIFFMSGLPNIMLYLGVKGVFECADAGFASNSEELKACAGVRIKRGERASICLKVGEMSSVEDLEECAKDRL